MNYALGAILVAGAFAITLAILVWSVLMAPTSRRRLADPGRLTLQIVLFVATGVVSALAGHGLWGIVIAAFGIAAFIAGRFFDDAVDPVERPSH